MDADRHLLFGLLALQNKVIDKRQLVSAFGQWMADHSKRLDEVLIEQQAITQKECDALACIVDFHVASQGGDVAASLRSLSTVDSVRNELESLADSDINKSIAKLNSIPDTIVPAYGSATSTGSRFEIRRPLDRGNLGIVSVALDKELNREVALKEIRSDRADDTSFRTKFVLEAEVTGGLEHPGIVPVYGFGTGPDGRPYYAMRLIKGDNFSRRIKQFHSDITNGKESYDGTSLRHLLRCFLDICQAVHYAHSRGVIHRDLKPSNVMLGKFGETLVVDWGLAKPLGAQTLGSTCLNQDTTESPLVPVGSDAGLTRLGSIVGTPAYAPPEQLSGNPAAQVDERSDVYGLGAILYELVTGKAPVQEASVEATIQVVLRGEIKAPRVVLPGIPKPIEAICLKAMALRPDDRYETAAALSQDIERWLDDLPVLAYPDPIVQKAWRWMRGHRAIVASMSIAVLMSTIGLGIYSSIVRNLNSKLDEQNTQLEFATKSAENFKADAIHRYAIAKQAIDTTLLGTSDSLFKIPGAKRLQAKLLQQAAEDYEKLSRNQSSDSELELERVRAIVRLADIYHLQNNTEASHQKYQESLSVLDDFVDKNAASVDRNSDAWIALGVERGKIQARIGLAFQYENMLNESKMEFEKAESVLRELVNEYPKSTLCRESLAVTLFNKSFLIDQIEGAEAAIVVLAESLKIFQQSESGSSAEHSLMIAKCSEGMGRLLRQLGRYDEARRSFMDAQTIHNKRLEGDTNNSDILEDLASLEVSKAHLERTVGDFDTSLRYLETASSMYEKLRRDYPDEVQIKENWAINETDIGAVLVDQGRPNDARTRAFPAAQMFDELVSAYPQLPSYRVGLATALSIVGQASMELTEGTPELDGIFQRSIELCEDLAKQVVDTGDTAYHRLLATVKGQYARYLHSNRKIDKARQAFDEAIAILDRPTNSIDNTLTREGVFIADSLRVKSVEPMDNMRERNSILAHSAWRRGLLEYDDREFEKATTYFSKAIAIWREQCESTSAAETHYQLALCLLRTPDESLRNLDEALKILKDIHKNRIPNLNYYNLLADVFIQKGDAESSQRLLDEIKQLRKSWTANDLCVLAKIQSANQQNEEVRKSLASARKWAKENRPFSDDVQRLIRATQETLLSE